ncbi:hypothetical protein AGMMS50256_17480 [Betaproteobacteria bacterium]|nr:hypothetical protein AGMMS50256_17480 [Betaproteobacteria bacterium]
MRLIYRTQDGQADYSFSFEPQSNGEIYIYIFKQPSYQGRNEDAHATHRYTDSRDGRKYICREPQPRTESDARKVAAAWADLTQEYIRSGKKF